MPSSGGSSQPRDQTCVSMSPALAGGYLSTSATWEVCYVSTRAYSIILGAFTKY